MTSSRRNIRETAALGELGGLVYTSGWQEAQALARTVGARRLPGVEDVVPAADSVGVLVDPDRAEAAEVTATVARLAAAPAEGRSRHFELDVCFDGPDLEHVAGLAGLRVDEVVAELVTTDLTVGWLGFMPGFPYLVGLREPLASVPRLRGPRPRQPPGSLALAGGYAGIYPMATPGGWNVVGRTAVDLFDAARPEPATFAPGDRLRLRPASGIGPAGVLAEGERAPLTGAGSRHLTVVDAGTLSLVQDTGRLGAAHLGVPRAGPADPLRHHLANAAVGNDEAAATLEVTGAGPTLRFGSESHIALVGDCPLRLDGREMPPANVQLVEPGQLVSVGIVRGAARAYLGVSGGLDLPPVLGSRATDAVSGLWPGPLRRGDVVGVGRPGRSRGRWFDPPTGPVVLQADPGPDSADEDALPWLCRSPWQVAPESDRVGTRLRPAEDARAAPPPSRPVTSRAMVTGAVQVPPDGCPVILGPDHGTVGGYPVVAVLRRASLSFLGQLRPGDSVRFEPAGETRAEPTAALARARVAGWLWTGFESGT